MKVQDFMTHGVRTVRPDDTLDTAARTMWEADCGAVPVLDQGSRVVGVLTDRDICMAAYTQGRPLQSIRVQSAMSKELVCCKSSDSLEQAEELMRRQKVRRLPVVDAQKRLIGLLSLHDVARAALCEPPATREARLRDAGQLLAEVSEPRARPSTAPELEPGLRKLSASALEIC